MKETRGKTGKSKKKRYLFCILVVLLLQGIGGIVAYAVLENGDSDTPKSVYVKDSEIEMSTLVIGSHLIHINGLTDQLYALAMNSANEFSQNQIYYKSELANGAWFEISEALSIADISASGTPVDKSVIESLEFTHKTGSDGITIDLRTEEATSVFDILNPYNLEGMEELNPLLLQYQILQEKTEKTDSDNSYIDMIRTFFERDVETDETKACDESLTALDTYRNDLNSREKPSMWKEQTDVIMESVDAERRIITLTKILHYLDNLETQANGLPVEAEEETEAAEDSGSTDEGGSEEVEANPELVVNSDIVYAIGECIKNVQESLLAYEAKHLSADAETATEKAVYNYSQNAIASAKSNDTSGCDDAIQKICDLLSILDGTISDPAKELETLKEGLIQDAYQKCAATLSSGESEDYKKAKVEGLPQTTLAQYLKQQKAAANADILEYQRLLEAALQRMSNEEAKGYVLQMIDEVPALNQSIQEDDAAPYLREVLEEYLEWLRKAYASLVKNGADSTQMEKFEQQKEDLEKQYRDAVDRGDFAEANRLKALLEAKQKDIDNLMDSLAAILKSPNSSEADKAKAKAEMGNSNTAALLNQMGSDLTSAIRSGTSGADGNTDAADLRNQLASLVAVAQLNPDAGKAVLDEVAKALEQATGLGTELAAELGNTVAKAKDEVDAASGAVNSQEALANLLDDILDRVFGTDFEHAGSDQKAAAILAMEWYGQKNNSDVALQLAGKLSLQAAEQKNAFLYDKYTLKDAYMSLQALGQTLGYRYIFDDVHVTVTLQKAKEYYMFAASDKRYKAAGGSSGKLKAKPKRMNTLYIHGEDSEKIFSTKAEYIEKSQYGVVGTPSVETKAKEVYERLLKGA